MKYIVYCYCEDCTGIDYYGCNAGAPWGDIFDSAEDAKRYATEEAESCSPHRAEVYEIKDCTTRDGKIYCTYKGEEIMIHNGEEMYFRIIFYIKGIYNIWL